MKRYCSTLALLTALTLGACTSTPTVAPQSAPAPVDTLEEDLGVIEAEDMPSALAQTAREIMVTNLSGLAEVDTPAKVVYNQINVSGDAPNIDTVITNYQNNGFVSVSYLGEDNPGTMVTVLYRADGFPAGGSLRDLEAAQLEDATLIGHFSFEMDEVINNTAIEFTLEDEVQESILDMGARYIVFNAQDSVRAIVGAPMDNPEAINQKLLIDLAGDFTTDGSERLARVVFDFVEASTLPSPKSYKSE